MNDLISRQAAIEAILKINDYNNSDRANALGLAEFAITTLPSAQPEIIRCKDCKWKQGAECVRFADVRPFADDFCSRAERRTDNANANA